MTDAPALLNLAAALRGPAPKDPQYATQVVDRLLQAAREGGASDIHLQPGAEGVEVLARIDGVLQRV